MLNYSISSVLWDPFSRKTLLEESSPARVGQVWRTVESAGKLLRIRNSRKQCDWWWPPIGHKNIFCAQSETSIRMSRGTRSLSIASKRLFLSFLKIFAAVFPDPTDRSWVSEDVVVVDQKKWSTVLFLSHLSPSTRSGYCVAVHVIDVKVQDFNYSFFGIIFLPPSLYSKELPARIPFLTKMCMQLSLKISSLIFAFFKSASQLKLAGVI